MAYRKIDLSDEDKIQWLNSNGGSFLSDYMALDVEQAKQKFRNLLAASQYHLVRSCITFSLSVNAWYIIVHFGNYLPHWRKR